MQQRESGQAVLCFQFAPEFIPYAGIAAVLDETFDERLLVYSMFHFTGHHHGGGGSHRDAVHHHFRTAAAHTGAVACGHRFIVPAEKLVGGCGPLQYVETVEPAHLYLGTLACTMTVQVGQKDVILQLPVVQVADVEHADGVVGIAVHNDGRFTGGFGGGYIQRMQGFTPVVLYIEVAQRPAVCRLSTHGFSSILPEHVFVGSLAVAGACNQFIRVQRMPQHIVSAAQQGGTKRCETYE